MCIYIYIYIYIYTIYVYIYSCTTISLIIIVLKNYNVNVAFLAVSKENMDCRLKNSDQDLMELEAGQQANSWFGCTKSFYCKLLI